jgi:hypothetical protein
MMSPPLPEELRKSAAALRAQGDADLSYDLETLADLIDKGATRE